MKLVILFGTQAVGKMRTRTSKDSELKLPLEVAKQIKETFLL